MEQNPPNEEATQIALSRADLFGLKAVKTWQLYLLQIISLDIVENGSYTVHEWAFSIHVKYNFIEFQSLNRLRRTATDRQIQTVFNFSIL